MGATTSKMLVNSGSIELVNIRSTKMVKEFSQHADSLIRVPFANGCHCEPTGRATARPMTGSAKQSIARQKESWIASSLRSSQ
jgi:hypothetical protein